MPIQGRYFPSQGSTEKVFLILRRHWFTYLAFLMIALIMTIPLLILTMILFSNTEIFLSIWGNIAIVGGSAYLLLIVSLLLYGFIDYYLDVYIVTDERIVDIEQNGFFKRGISELHLHQVQDVTAKVKGALPTMMHYGDILIQTAGERGNFVFNSIPNPYRVSKIILDLHEAQIEDNRHVDNKTPNKKPKYEEVGKNNLDSIDSKTFGLARKRTKDFINGKKLVETSFEENVTSKLDEDNRSKILKATDEEIKKMNSSSDVENKTAIFNDKSKSSAMIDNKTTENVDLESGEMHENEEIDI